MPHKNQNIKKYYKKSILPSVIMLIVFLGICVWLFVMLVALLEGYLLESKASALHDEANRLSGLLTEQMRKEDVNKAVASLKNHMKKDSDICVMDEKGRVLYQFGETTPDIGRARNESFAGEFTVFPDMDPRNPNRPPIWEMSYTEIVKQSIETAPKAENEDEWFEGNAIESYVWIEIPVQADGCRIYYKDTILFTRKNAVYVIGVSIVSILMALLPILLLVINVISSVITQRRMVYLLYLDTVTGGKNWLHFTQRSQKILRRFRNLGNTYAVVNLHMDRYQDYCACYGSRDGEELLKSVNSFLQVNIRRQETFARFAVADFGLFLRCDSIEQCEKRLKKLLAELTGIRSDKALSYHAVRYLIHSAAGRPDIGKQERKQINIDQVYSYANAAREALDERDGEYIKVFDDQILQEQLWKRKVEDVMEEALLNKEFQLYLQPKYDPVSEKVVSAEALVRWMSPTDGIILPKRFIPIFEENGFITKLDDYMISAAARLQAEWKIQGRRIIPISVNISRANFAKENLAQHICQLVDGYGADHNFIELELTESAFFGDKDILQKILKELKAYGFRISMDDFGVGYSSLNSLKDLPIDILKLDVEFFRGEDTDKRGEVIVKEVIHLAKNLNMKTVAEGIERKDQVEFLVEQGCDMIQGYYFAKPMPVSEFEEQM